MVSATTVRHLPALSWLASPAICLLAPGTYNSACLWIERPGAYMGAYSQVRLGLSYLWRVEWTVCSGVYLRVS